MASSSSQRAGGQADMLARGRRRRVMSKGVFDIRAVQGLASEPAQASHGPACGAQVHLFDLHVAFGQIITFLCLIHS